MKSLSLLCALLLSFVVTSCNQHSFHYLNPTSVNLAICEIDSTKTALDKMESENPEAACHDDTDPSSQEIYDTAKNTWESFIAKCYKQDYKGAYDLYCEPERQGDFAIFLEYSGLLYQFDRDVLAPIVYEYEDQNKADSLYIEALKLEYILTTHAMKQSVGDADNIPSEYPNLINDLGCLLSQTGRIDDAFKLLDDFAYAIHCVTEDDAQTNWAVTYLAATFYLNAGQIDEVINTLEQYKDYLREREDTFAEREEYEYYMNEAEEHIQSIKAEYK